MIDYQLYPHIVETIINFATEDTLAHRTRVEYALRLVSRWVADRVDASLFSHIEIDRFDGRINIEGTSRRPLPGFRLRRYIAIPIDLEDADLDASPSPLRLLRFARVVDFRAPITEYAGERLYPVLRDREVDVMRNLWTDRLGNDDAAACPLRCAKFVTRIEWQDRGRLALDSELLAPAARSIAVTFSLPEEMHVDHLSLSVEGEMERCDEVVVRYAPLGTGVVVIDLSESSGGLGVLHGFVEPMRARGGTLTLTLVGAEALDQALFGLPGKAYNAAHLKAHIVDAICASGSRSAALEAAVKVQTFEERKRVIGEAAFDLET